MASDREPASSGLAGLTQVVRDSIQVPLQNQSILRQSLLFAELSHLAYFSPEQVKQAVEQSGIEGYEFLNQESAQAYIFTTIHDCIVVFRGTEPDDINDIKADVDAVMVVAETLGRVHRGFKRESDRLWEPLERLLTNNQKPLWFTGHSLGGAIATLNAGRCVLSPIPASPSGLYTFGSPRVGNRRFINYVKLNHYRWVNNNDIVPRLPPRWLGYRHAGKELYLNAYGKVRTYTTWRRIRDQWLGFLITLRAWKVDHVTDHLITSYIGHLQKAVDEEAQARRLLMNFGNSQTAKS